FLPEPHGLGALRPVPAQGARGRGGEPLGERNSAPRAPWSGTPRNAACPCGSGKKFKHCHGRV
ncbi:MAG TPA: SEC-C metal-binding domain-containing protein, partial [Stellaceae bacterium]|nr:SEC-C metal-binding domain-containing protein [Stellaceae bacterium]